MPRSSINLCVCQLEMVIFLALRMNWRQREIRVEAFLCFALADTKEGKTRKPRKAAWTEYLVHGRKICRKTFSFLHGMSDTTLKRVSGHYDKFGLKKRFETQSTGLGLSLGVYRRRILAYFSLVNGHPYFSMVVCVLVWSCAY